MISSLRRITNLSSHLNSDRKLFLKYRHILPITTSASVLSRNFVSSGRNLLGAMKVVNVPVNSDNYAYLLIDENSKTAAAVDPAEPEKVINAANEQGVKITHILTTHHHGDHSGGNKELSQKLGSADVYGGDDRIPALTKKVKEGDTFKVGDINVKVHFTPCHTSGHVLYECKDASAPAPALFTGDTLFIGGCGRFFEGSADQMYHALIEVVAKLPKQTQVFCGHEYTVKNLEFGLSIEPDNASTKQKLEWAKQKRANNEATVPSTVEEELTFNPFMRVHEKTIASSLKMEGSSPTDVMAELRKRKDKF